MPTAADHLPLKTTLIIPDAEALKPYLARGASPELAACLYWFNRTMKEKNCAVLVYCVYRSNATQAELYSRGRTKPGRIVTNAKPGQSMHNRTFDNLPASDAFDACPVIDGKPTWATTGPALQSWQFMGETAEALGMQWGKHFKHLGGDWAHFQYQRSSTPQKGITA